MKKNPSYCIRQSEWFEKASNDKVHERKCNGSGLISFSCMNYHVGVKSQNPEHLHWCIATQHCIMNMSICKRWQTLMFIIRELNNSF